MTFGKLLLLLLVLAAVWVGYRYAARIDAFKNAALRASRSRPVPPGRTQAEAQTGALDTEDMVRCRVCNTFVAARPGATPRCERPDCPN